MTTTSSRMGNVPVIKSWTAAASAAFSRKERGSTRDGRNSEVNMSEREFLASWWNSAWTEGLWAAAWSKSIDGLSAEQAAWTPANGRHSIWQIVLHMLFWREDCLRRIAGGGKPSEAEVQAKNFPAITDPSQQAWDSVQRRFAESQKQVAAVLADSAAPLDRAAYLLPHDSYHMGQINYLRAMQGLPAIE
ncbi:MAG: DinB family protein [Planctomycetes bacterium]|nr:DinB family protein [Planctomycetota bacterium]